jgi:Transposase IS66 family
MESGSRSDADWDPTFWANLQISPICWATHRSGFRFGAETQENQARRSDPLRLSRWTGLCLFLEDGRVEIDNNVVEGRIRPLALTRKNTLFAGSDGGAEHWAAQSNRAHVLPAQGFPPGGHPLRQARP